MPKCKLYPNFTISLNGGLEAEYRIAGLRYEKRVLETLLDDLYVMGWSECSMANYALALLKAHAQAEEA